MFALFKHHFNGPAVVIYFNGASGVNSFKSTTITRDDIAKGYKHIEINKPYVNSVQLYIFYNSDVAVSATTDFAPSFALVDYSPTNTKG